MRVLALILSLAAFVAVAALSVAQEVRATQLAYGIARQEEYAESLQQRIDELEARVLHKFPPQVIYRVATELRVKRSAETGGPPQENVALSP